MPWCCLIYSSYEASKTRRHQSLYVCMIICTINYKQICDTQAYIQDLLLKLHKNIISTQSTHITPMTYIGIIPFERHSGSEWRRPVVSSWTCWGLRGWPGHSLTSWEWYGNSTWTSTCRWATTTQRQMISREIHLEFRDFLTNFIRNSALCQADNCLPPNVQ